jgi:hypothetical protein
MARPRKQIDYKLVEKLGKIHCTQEEIAQVSGLSVDTLQPPPAAADGTCESILQGCRLNKL